MILLPQPHFHFRSLNLIEVNLLEAWVQVRGFAEVESTFILSLF
jgi:hypothetical protein